MSLDCGDDISQVTVPGTANRQHSLLPAPRGTLRVQQGLARAYTSFSGGYRNQARGSRSLLPLPLQARLCLLARSQGHLGKLFPRPM